MKSTTDFPKSANRCYYSYNEVVSISHFTTTNNNNNNNNNNNMRFFTNRSTSLSQGGKCIHQTEQNATYRWTHSSIFRLLSKYCNVAVAKSRFIISQIVTRLSWSCLLSSTI